MPLFPDKGKYFFLVGSLGEILIESFYRTGFY
jgi:hypothetical protein